MQKARIYFKENRWKIIILLLAETNRASKKDIDKAKEIWNKLKNNEKWKHQNLTS